MGALGKLEQLSLGSNQIGDKGATALGEALAVNASLKLRTLFRGSGHRIFAFPDAPPHKIFAQTDENLLL